MVKVKICGITNLEDAKASIDFGADALGFVFYKQSPRYIKPSVAKSIIIKLPPFISSVGLFVNESKEKVIQIARFCNFGVIQLHGNESHSFCLGFREKIIKAFRVTNESSLETIGKYKVSAILLDTFSKDNPGGTGKTFDWKLAQAVKEKSGKIILSGGLTPNNVAEAIKLVKPYGVDVSSGVEKEYGKKDHDKLREFIRIAGSIVI
ncbi:MAG: phosphoribosylanthranilate isomerase [bacterium]